MASEYDNSQLQDVINAYADENTEPLQDLLDAMGVNLMDNELDQLATVVNLHIGGTGTGGYTLASMPTAVGVNVEIGGATPYEASQVVTSVNPTLLNDTNLTRDELFDRVEEALAGNEWRLRSEQVGYAEAVTDIIDRMRSGVDVEPVANNVNMTPTERGQALYPTPPALRNQEWLGQPQSAYWRVRDLEPEPDFLESPPANPRNIADMIDNRFADMRLSQLDRQNLTNRSLTGADAERSSFIESNLSRVDADHAVSYTHLTLPTTPYV